jgi:AAA15 family ATPase/GTPase
MLIQFSVSNYRSIKELATISFVASSDKELLDSTFKTKNEMRLLKSAVVFGANASGKSNIFKAISFMRFFIRNSSRSTQFIDKISVESFKLSTETEHKPSFFEIDFIVDNVLYKYGFEVDTQKVHSEWLFHKQLNKHNSRISNLFTREFIKNEYKYSINAKFKEGHGLENRTRNNALFLSVVAQFNGEISQQLLQWFTTKINVISGFDDHNYMDFATKCIQDDDFRNEMLKFTQVADLSIDELIPKQLAMSSSKLQNLFSEEVHEQSKINTPLVVYTSHKVFNKNNLVEGNARFNLGKHESEGTQKFVYLSAPIIDTLRKGKALLIDELDSRLHPLITEYIIRLFNSKKTNPNNAQLFFAAHSTMLLGNKYFRRDQVWFTEKNTYGATKAFSLDDYLLKVRKDESYEKNYLRGKYGAIPYVDYIKAFNSTINEE